MAVTIKINTVDKSSDIDTQSVVMQQVLTSQVDTLEFSIRRGSGSDYKPELLDDVLLEEDGVKLFGGVIVEIGEEVKGRLEYVSVKCRDYAYEMDRKLVIEQYENMTVEDIIADINTTYLTGFDITNVSCPLNVPYIRFNYEQPSKCLQQLAELVEYDWYVDPEKKIYFFSKSSFSAPFNLTDTNGKYVYNSLKIRKNVNNIKNTIYVRGGEYLGALTTEKFVADGQQTTFFQAYKYNTITVKKATVTQTVGIDFIDDPGSFNCMYNFNEKAVKFPTAPTAGQVIEVSGYPYIPVIIKLSNWPSITQYGVQEFKIVDKSINSKEGARTRALAEISAWANQIDEGGFKTISTGLRAGQQINVQSTIRGIDEDFVISRITSRMQTPTNMVHDITLVTKYTFGMVEFLQKLLIQKDKEIDIKENEVLDKVESIDETITLSETNTFAKIHNPVYETITLGESTTVQALNYAVEFVVGEYTPSGTKRVFVLDGSPLG